MNIRAAVICLSVALSGVGVPAFAQPATPPKGAASAATPIDPVAASRNRFQDGVRLAKGEEWEKAYAAFLEAWKLYTHPQIALNLGAAEKELGKDRDASEHLRYCIDHDTNPANVEQARRWLVETKKKVVTLTITVEGAGAEVLIDGKSVGMSPLPPEVYVEAGKHTVGARLGPAHAVTTDTYSAGQARTIKLVPKKPPAARVESAPTASATAVSRPGVPEKGSWAGASPRTAVLIGGGVVALAGVGIGVAGLVLAGQKTAERDVYCEWVEDKCLTTQVVDPARYAAEKKVWTGLDGERVSFGNMGIAGLIVGGIAAAGTGITYWLWKPSSPKAEAKQGIVIMPAGAGVVVRGNW